MHNDTIRSFIMFIRISQLHGSYYKHARGCSVKEIKSECQLKKQAPKIFRKNITYELLMNTCIRNVLEIIFFFFSSKFVTDL